MLRNRTKELGVPHAHLQKFKQLSDIQNSDIILFFRVVTFEKLHRTSLISWGLNSNGRRINSFAPVAKQIVKGSAWVIISFLAETGTNVVSKISIKFGVKNGLLAIAQSVLESSCGLKSFPRGKSKRDAIPRKISTWKNSNVANDHRVVPISLIS